MKVKNHNKFRLFDYTNHMTNPNFQLGEVLFKESALHPENEGQCNPIGVVIQLHDDGDCRTDMYGNVSPSEVRLATYNEILQYQPTLIADVFEPLKVGDKVTNPEVNSNGPNYEGEVIDIYPLFYSANDESQFFGMGVDVQFRDFKQGYAEWYIAKNKI